MNDSRVYEIRIEGHLTDRWSEWFDGLAIHHDGRGETTLTGPLTDQAALFGLLAKLQALNLILISVNALLDEGSTPDMIQARAGQQES